ncbi:hypothetical protein F5X96DRAFT_672741 [Biscogniauxia mediterranea]|nr:hypothetical protein F5X96DRAFT_672741 [Biscogniauxia mediterranea]
MSSHDLAVYGLATNVQSQPPQQHHYSDCTDGYCWKRCGDKNCPWCWTARSGGFGAWYTCGADADCQASFACGQKADGDCKSCGWYLIDDFKKEKRVRLRVGE